MAVTRRALVAGLLAGIGAGCSGIPERSVFERLKEFRPGRGVGRGSPSPVQVREWRDQVAGKDRTGWVAVPSRYTPDRKWPVVLFSHGHNQDGRLVLTKFEWDWACEERGYIGLFPDTGGNFTQGLPDNTFFARLLDRAIATFEVDTERIFVGGFSGGCKRAYSFAANHSQRIAALAGHSGTMGHLEEPSEYWDPRVHAVAPINLLHIHGQNDATVAPRGQLYVAEDGVARNTVPMKDGMEIWASVLGAELVRHSPRPAGVPERCDYYEWRSPDGHVLAGVVDPDLSHVWAPYATEVVANFFDRAPPRLKPTGTPPAAPTL